MRKDFKELLLQLKTVGDDMILAKNVYRNLDVEALNQISLNTIKTFHPNTLDFIPALSLLLCSKEKFDLIESMSYKSDKTIVYTEVINGKKVKSDISVVYFFIQRIKHKRLRRQILDLKGNKNKIEELYIKEDVIPFSELCKRVGYTTQRFILKFDTDTDVNDFLIYLYDYNINLTRFPNSVASGKRFVRYKTAFKFIKSSYVEPTEITGYFLKEKNGIPHLIRKQELFTYLKKNIIIKNKITYRSIVDTYLPRFCGCYQLESSNQVLTPNRLFNLDEVINCLDIINFIVSAEFKGTYRKRKHKLEAYYFDMNKFNIKYNKEWTISKIFHFFYFFLKNLNYSIY